MLMEKGRILAAVASWFVCLGMLGAPALAEPSEGAVFDGERTGIEIEAGDRFDTGEITVAAWVKLNSHDTPQIVMNRGQRGELITFYLWTDGFRMLVQYEGETYTQALAEAPAVGQWTHLLGTYDGEKIVIYVNGEAVDRAAASGQIPSSDAPLYVGTQAAGINALDGELADVRVYNAALTADQAAAVADGDEPAEQALLEKLDVAALNEAQQTFEPTKLMQKTPGYRPIWFDLGQESEYGSKYSGALGTYTAKHHPLLIYSEEANKTFFVYGGTTAADERHLLAMASYYDHETGEVPQPTVVHDKQGVDDPHDNPSLQIDSDGHLWIFVSGRGRSRPGITYRSTEPYSIEEFELIRQAEYTYPQPWWVEGEGFIKLFTKYTAGRELYWSLSETGREWGEDQKLAGMGGHYQMSNERDGRIITAFNMHPGGNVDKRTNLYFAQTFDMGETWETIDGQQLETPLEDVDSPALVRDYRSEDRLVYLKDINFDADGNPILLHISSADYQPGPDGQPRRWTVAHWTGDEWAFHEVAEAWHNYDMGSLYVEDDGVWRIIAPTEVGPQQWGVGGEVAMWTSDDQGETWTMQRQMTRESQYNHAYVRRPVNVHPDFYGFWADGSPDELTPSHLHFTNKEGDVWRFPYEMDEPFAKPEKIE